MFLCHFLSGQDRIDVDSNGVFHSSRVAAGECRRHRNSEAARFLENLPSRCFNLLSLVTVHRADLRSRGRRHQRKKEYRPEFIERLLHRWNQRAQILIVVGAVGHVEIDARWRLVRRIIVFLMNRNREDVGSFRKIAGSVP